MDIPALLQTFGFPVALAIALIYWWRRDYSDLVKRMRHVEEGRAADLKAYANSYQTLAERITEALEQHNLLMRQHLRTHGETPWGDTNTPKPHPVVKPEKYRTPVPFPMVEHG